jgi:hypothetical protein
MSVKKSLEKFIEQMVKKKYPFVKNIRVIEDTFYDKFYYKVFVGATYNDLFGGKDNTTIYLNDEIPKYIKDISKYILNKDEEVTQVNFYDPEGYY